MVFLSAVIRTGVSIPMGEAGAAGRTKALGRISKKETLLHSRKFYDVICHLLA